MQVTRGDQVVYIDSHDVRRIAMVAQVLEGETGMVELLRADGIAQVTVMPRGTPHTKTGRPIELQCYYGAQLSDDERREHCAAKPGDELARQRLALAERERELEHAELRAKERDIVRRERELAERGGGD